MIFSSVWLISLSTTLSRSIHVTENDIISFFCVCDNCLFKFKKILQPCVDFCYTTMQISHNYTTSPPSQASHLLSHPFRSSQQQAELPGIQQPSTSFYLHMVTYIFQCYSFTIHPTISFPHCVHKSILYVSNPALQIGSSVPFFWILSQGLKPEI